MSNTQTIYAPVTGKNVEAKYASCEIGGYKNPKTGRTVKVIKSTITINGEFAAERFFYSYRLRPVYIQSKDFYDNWVKA